MATTSGKRPDVIERWPLDRLRPSPLNSRQHPQAQIEQLAASIRQWGFTVPVLAAEDGEIIAGEGRWQAARMLGLPDAPVIVARNWTDEQKMAYREADNQLGENSRWDDAKRAVVLGKLIEAGFDIALIGISEADRKELLADDGDTLVVREIPTGDVADEFWISIRGPLKHQADVLQHLRSATRDLNGVSVEMGTIAFDQ